jgi:hypothetical protein
VSLLIILGLRFASDAFAQGASVPRLKSVTWEYRDTIQWTNTTVHDQVKRLTSDGSWVRGSGGSLTSRTEYLSELYDDEPRPFLSFTHVTTWPPSGDATAVTTEVPVTGQPIVSSNATPAQLPVEPWLNVNYSWDTGGRNEVFKGRIKTICEIEYVTSGN